MNDDADPEDPPRRRKPPRDHSTLLAALSLLPIGLAIYGLYRIRHAELIVERAKEKAARTDAARSHHLAPLNVPDDAIPFGGGRRMTVPRGERTVGMVKRELGPVAKEAFAAECKYEGIAWPPRRVTLLAFKAERRLEVWAANRTGKYARIGAYDILAASGKPGPKRREGDWQVPEGIYRIDSLNPNSQFHLSLDVNYPNADDTAHRLGIHIPQGTDIFVHGNAVSIGCIAIGDAAIEEVFPLVALANPNERRILIAPVDLRSQSAPPTTEPWLRDRYTRLKKALRMYTL